MIVLIALAMTVVCLAGLVLMIECDETGWGLSIIVISFVAGLCSISYMLTQEHHERVAMYESGYDYKTPCSLVDVVECGLGSCKVVVNCPIARPVAEMGAE